VTQEPADGTGNEQPTELRDSSPNAGGPDRAAGDMGVSSEREDGRGTDGETDTSEPRSADQSGEWVGSDAEFAQNVEENPDGIDPKAGYPSQDPRSDDLPYQDS
jgi:hypothetical protein